MNNLNLVVIEGKVAMSSIDYVNDSEIYFTLKLTRFYKKDGKGVTEEHFIPIKVESRLFTLCKNKFTSGKNEVRITGRIDTCQGFLIKAEHIEFKRNFVEEEGA